jgi:uncharacterized protein YecE (DUF72 family)
MGKTFIGISSWTEPTLVEGGKFYPPEVKSAEARLKYYSSQFPIVEVDSSYYALPVQRTAWLWVDRTPEEFIFNIKAFRLFTQHPTSLVALPEDVRKEIPAEARAKNNLYYHDVPAEIRNELWKRFADAILPLGSTSKLGVVVFQFPPWFFPGDEQREHILECQHKLPQYRIAVEFRHNSWFNEKNLEKVVRFLHDNRISYICVDEPQGFKTSIPPLALATADIGVVRFHGRNTRMWEKESHTAAKRFNYLYSEEELKEWEPRVTELASQTQQLHILFNNCYDDKAVRNARQLAMMLD